MSEARRRIVFLLPTLMAGGAERVLITLMNGLDRTRFEPHLVALDDTGPLRDWVAAEIPVHGLGGVKLRFAIPPLIRILNKLSPDTVVSTMAGMNFTALLAKPFLNKRMKFIVREAVVPSSIIESQALPGMLRAAYRALYPRADLVIAPSKLIIEEFQNDLGMDIHDYRLLYNPVDTRRMLEQWPVDVEISEGRAHTVHFVAAGRLHKQKGFDRLIEALPRLKMQTPWKLMILGEGAERENLEILIRAHGLEHQVKLPGLIKNPWPIYAAADAFLLPSRWEGLPNVALKSLAAGTKVIAMTEAGGIGEIALLATENAVTLVDSMDEFVATMAAIKPAPAETRRPSLLPKEFEMENVMRAFEGFL